MKNYLIVFGLLGILIVGIVGLKLQSDKPLGSVSVTGEYEATTTSAGRFPVVYTLKNGRGALGQVTITGPAYGSISLYNATTSDINLRTNNLSTSSLLIADFPANIATSTYTFDQIFTTGLLIVTNETMPTSTITFR